MTCPLDYSLCNKTVTLYRFENGRVHRRLLHNVYYQWQHHESYDALGQQMKTTFLLIIPGKEEYVYPGNRVMEGVGPAISAHQWQQFVPEKYYGLSEVGYVKPCYWEGEICHYEAGRS